MASTPLLQSESDAPGDAVGAVELLFDLIFVFAVTQLSHQLLLHLTVTGTIEAAVVLAALWWLWVLTTWATNGLNTQSSGVRLVLFVMMIGALVLATSLPDAFADKGMIFAGAYVTLQLGRTAFVWFAHRADDERKGHFARMGLWLLVSGAFWLAGALVESPALRIGLWVAALAIDYLAAGVGYWVPGIGRSPSDRIDVEGGHLAERVGLFLIIALGESILVTGQTFADQAWTPTSISAVLAAVIGAIAMWWIYFGKHADAATEVIESSAKPGRIARRAYTYTPLLMVAGIVVTAVGDELVIDHPQGTVSLAMQLTVLGGPALFLIGAQLFKWEVFRRLSMPRLAGLVALAAVAVFAQLMPPLAIAWGATAILIAVGLAELFLGKAVAPRREAAPQ